MLNPGLTAGYFITDNIAVGLSPSYTYQKSTRKHTSEDIVQLSSIHTIHRFNVSPYLRVYKQLFNSKAYFFGQGTVYDYQVLKSKHRYESIYGEITHGENKESSHRHRFGIGLSPGINYFVTDKVALEVMLDGIRGFYSIGNVEREQSNGEGVSSSTRAFDYGLNLNLRHLNFGFVFFL